MIGTLSNVLGDCTHVVSLSITDTGVEVVYRRPSNAVYACNPPRPMPDHVWRERWEVIEGVLTLVERAAGLHTPARIVPEEVTFQPSVLDRA